MRISSVVVLKMSRASGSFGAALGYALAEPKRAELIPGNMCGRDARALTREFGDWAAFNERVRRPVFHCSLSAGPSEAMTAERWRDLARELLDRLGYGDSPWVAIRHQNRGHDHVHVIACRVDSLGHRVPSPWEKKQGLNILRYLERRLGLLPAAQDYARRAPSRGQLASFELTGRIPAAARLQEHLDLAARGRPPMGLFVERLEAADVQVRPNFDPEYRLNGISFALDGVALRGSRLGPEYSWRGLQERKGISYQAARDLPALLAAEGRSAASALPAAGREAALARTDADKMPALENPVQAYRAAAALAVRCELLSRQERVAALHGAAADKVRTHEELVRRLDLQGRDLERREQAFWRTVDESFARPREAGRRIAESAEREGCARTGRLLAEHPERLGSLRGLGVAALDSPSRREARDEARSAGRQLSEIGRLRTELAGLEARVEAMAAPAAAARQETNALGKSLLLLPTAPQLQREIAEAARALGAAVVRALPLAAPGMTRALSMLARLARDQAIELGRGLGRDDGGLER